MSGLNESEWLLQRLCESLIRLSKRAYVPQSVAECRESGAGEGVDMVDDEKAAGKADAGEEAVVPKNVEETQK